jgi:hypothetical protein
MMTVDMGCIGESPYRVSPMRRVGPHPPEVALQAGPIGVLVWKEHGVRTKCIGIS